MIGVFDISTGELVEVVKSLEGVDLTNCDSCNRPAAWSPDSWSWSAHARQWVEDAEKVEASLIAQVDARREEMRAAVMTPGAGQSYAYAQKAAEVADYRRWATELAEMDEAATIARFPFAMAEAAASGDGLATVIDRFDGGMTLSRSEIARVEAVACAAKRAIRAAEGLPAKQAAFDAIAWTAD